MAIEMGADFIEPDVVVTKDGTLVARHEPMLSGRPTWRSARNLLRARQRARSMASTRPTGSRATSPLLRSSPLRTKQSMPDRDQSKNGQFQIPSLEEVITLAKTEARARGRTIGIAPETEALHLPCRFGATDGRPSCGHA
jgi:glycerophosphoryl diester phosphodiesterase